MLIGKQEEGSSSPSILKMALEATDFILNKDNLIACDIGAGKGDLTKILSKEYKHVKMVEYAPPSFISQNVEILQTDLNGIWPLEDNSIDVLFSLEVIEHIENPRHFFREISRILKINGIAFISTPNCLNLFSRLNYLIKGEHRFFQDSCYPAHISALTKKDLYRITHEVDLQCIKFAYNYEDVIPVFGKQINIKTPLLSNSIGILVKKVA